MHRITLALLLLSSPALSATLECRVIGVADGDTLTCLTADKRQERIRLRGIDAPERKQSFGERSRQNLSNLAYGKTATIHWTKRDHWKRIIGSVWVDPADCPGCGHTLDAGRAQLANGMAWWYERYAKEQPQEERHAYEFEQAEARARSVGLWRDPQPIPPWDWRRGKR
ncbi:thermonuclease family protein [Stutzerimonas nitrititolerans]|uniref:Thermonuclease family protein n=1 Tax=Stutzerimonas nitrititolerans TaxID=2482751 RepID=A0ABX9USP3_9GAMM|nr:thermonuclease family protein [Stutzerimonas nitrititolerans]RMH96313.1 thermonuclease family protein [Stutzerimonas nitrititolerans]